VDAAVLGMAENSIITAVEVVAAHQNEVKQEKQRERKPIRELAMYKPPNLRTLQPNELEAHDAQAP
jgi:hypothetical protein